MTALARASVCSAPIECGEAVMYFAIVGMGLVMKVPEAVFVPRWRPVVLRRRRLRQAHTLRLPQFLRLSALPARRLRCACALPLLRPARRRVPHAHAPLQPDELAPTCPELRRAPRLRRPERDARHERPRAELRARGRRLRLRRRRTRLRAAPRSSATRRRRRSTRGVRSTPPSRASPALKEAICEATEPAAGWTVAAPGHGVASGPSTPSSTSRSRSTSRVTRSSSRRRTG